MSERNSVQHQKPLKSLLTCSRYSHEEYEEIISRYTNSCFGVVFHALNNCEAFHDMFKIVKKHKKNMHLSVYLQL